MFGSDHYGIEPDLITIAKGLTSAYAPLSGSIVGDKVWKVLEQGTDELGAIGHGWTYSAHPICAAAGVANLEAHRQPRPRRRTPARPAPISAPRLRDALAGHPHVGEVRGDGMLAAVEFVEDRDDPPLLRPRRARSARSRRRRAARPRRHRAAPCRRATSSASRRRSA